MASVCAGTLALMDAGVPIFRPVAGISIGKVSDRDRHVLLTDILGEEDHYGDMDFKVAGTQKGITGIQLDLKERQIGFDVIRAVFELARNARIKILQTMLSVIPAPRPDLSIYAPKLITIQIPVDMIGKVIGPGGREIKAIQEKTGATVEIEDDGTVYISCVGGDNHLRAKELIELIVEPAKVGKTYTGRVVSVKDFGAFIEIAPGQEGLCHISELADHYVQSANEAAKVGDELRVKVIAVDEQGRIKLSRKAVEREEKGLPEAPAARGGSGGRRPMAPRS
jgi:polyribonucleotide nucleotidyltransferase